jgi:hypothetical protein
MRETEKESRKIKKRFINKERKKKRKRMTEKSLTTFQDQNPNPHCIFVCRSFLSFQHFLKQQKT